MMNILGFVVLVSQLAHAEPIKQADLWSDCVQSYKQSKAVFFDVAFNENDPKKHIMFRNGKNFAPEGLNIFHNGFRNNVNDDILIDLLSNEAIKEAIKNNFVICHKRQLRIVVDRDKDIFKC